MRAAKGHWQLLLVAGSAGISENDRCTHCNRLYTSCITSQSLSLKNPTIGGSPSLQDKTYKRAPRHETPN